MGWQAAGVIVAALSATASAVQGDQQRKAAKRSRKRQGEAQAAALARQSAQAARSRGREEQVRRGRQLAIANAARTGLSDNPVASPTKPSSTLG